MRRGRSKPGQSKIAAEQTRNDPMSRLALYFKLIRADKPIGIVLLLWPTLIALWIASNGKPDPMLVLIFTVGTALMRSAGCAINDYADRDFDKHVKRTAERPLTSGKIQSWEALAVAGVLAAVSFLLVLPLNGLTKQLSVAALIIAGTYPYFKRFFAIPQAYLGIAFGFGIPMAYAAVQDRVPPVAWLLLLANIFWTLAYDTEYAMVDRDVAIIMFCYAAHLLLLLACGWQLGLRGWFCAGLAVATGMALYHYTLIRGRQRDPCFTAFRHNNWLGAAIFVGITLDYALR